MKLTWMLLTSPGNCQVGIASAYELGNLGMLHVQEYVHVCIGVRQVACTYTCRLFAKGW